MSCAMLVLILETVLSAPGVPIQLALPTIENQLPSDKFVRDRRGSLIFRSGVVMVGSAFFILTSGGRHGGGVHHVHSPYPPAIADILCKEGE